MTSEHDDPELSALAHQALEQAGSPARGGASAETLRSASVWRRRLAVPVAAGLIVAVVAVGVSLSRGGSPRGTADGPGVPGQWPLSAVLNDCGTATTLGAAVALSGDGSTALYGIDSVDGGSGTVLVLQRSGGQWALLQRLSAPSAASSFGAVVALSSNGLTAVVGAPGASAGAGEVDIYTRTHTGAFSLSGELVGGDAFGSSVAVSGNGTVVAGMSQGEQSQVEMWNAGLSARGATGSVPPPTPATSIVAPGPSVYDGVVALNAGGNELVLGTGTGAQVLIQNSSSPTTLPAYQLRATLATGSAATAATVSADGGTVAVAGVSGHAIDLFALGSLAPSSNPRATPVGAPVPQVGPETTLELPVDSGDTATSLAMDPAGNVIAADDPNSGAYAFVDSAGTWTRTTLAGSDPGASAAVAASNGYSVDHGNAGVATDMTGGIILWAPSHNTSLRVYGASLTTGITPLCVAGMATPSPALSSTSTTSPTATSIPGSPSAVPSPTGPAAAASGSPVSATGEAIPQ